jgi:hypothetical protein
VIQHYCNNTETRVADNRLSSQLFTLIWSSSQPARLARSVYAAFTTCWRILGVLCVFCPR